MHYSLWKKFMIFLAVTSYRAGQSASRLVLTIHGKPGMTVCFRGKTTHFHILYTELKMTYYYGKTEPNQALEYILPAGHPNSAKRQLTSLFEHNHICSYVFSLLLRSYVFFYILFPLLMFSVFFYLSAWPVPFDTTFSLMDTR